MMSRTRRGRRFFGSVRADLFVPYEFVMRLPRSGEQLLRQAKLGEGEKPCKRIDMTETFYATQQVRILTGQGWPPAGIECCVVRG